MLEYILRGEVLVESFKTGLDKTLEKVLQQICIYSNEYSAIEANDLKKSFPSVIS